MFKYIQIETTTFCNASCWFCPNHLVPKEHMDIDLIYKIINDTRNRGITYRPFGLGEPLVDTRMPEICRYIKQDPTAIVEIHSNGEPMTAKMELNIAPYVDIVRFSVDGFTEKTFNEVRGIKFKNTYDNVTRFIKNNPNIDIQVRMINLPGTELEQVDFINYWNNIRPGCAQITELYDHPWETQTESLQASCKKVTDEAFVFIDGTMYLCPWDFGKRNPVGKIDYNTSAVDIWYNEKYSEYRQLLDAGKRCDINLCSRCSAVF
mgnify:FL=1|tara:strand:- start:5405 stop:6193 length:789 start_codon:yes stop_codon:yes gene_type:complete